MNDNKDIHKQIINHFTDTDLYKLTMCCAVIDNFPRAQVKYVFVDRNNTEYPSGFAKLVEEQILMLENVKITEEEIEYMKKKCYYIPNWFYKYLRGFKYNHEWIKVWQDKENHLHFEIEGYWANTILLEVQLLAIVSELYYRVTGLDKNFDYDAYYTKSYNKAIKMLSNGCCWSDFGPRRRASYRAEEVAVQAMIDADKQMHKEKEASKTTGRFVGTSNVYLAMKFGVTPIGTMAHEWICAIAAFYGPTMANNLAMRYWTNTYHGSLGTVLYDSFGWDIFALNLSEDYARLFAGFRIDSGDNHEQFYKIKNKLASFGIPIKEKQIVFSNALDIDRACELQKEFGDQAKIAFGIGTSWTNDFDGVKPMNIVIKLVAAKITESWPFYNETCKISEDKGKHTGKPEVIQRYMDILHITQ